MNRFFFIIKNDFRGQFNRTTNSLYLRSLSVLSNLYMLNILNLHRIKYGKNYCFWGKTNIYRYIFSKISFGNNCNFRSSSKSNLIGLNRRCSISTHSPNASIEIGNSCGFSGTIVAAAENIRIGNFVSCGANTTITDFDWHPIKKGVDNDYGKSKPINIEDNVWLGLNVLVLKGVTIGKNSIIGANSVVVSSIPENVLAAGNPCKIIKNIER